MLGAVTSASAKAAGISAAAPAVTSAAKALAIVKWLGLVVALGAVAGAVLHRRSSPNRTQVPLAAPRALPAAAQSAEPSASMPMPTPTAVTDPESTPAVSGAPPPSAVGATAAHVEPDITLEIAALDRARRAADGGNFAAALMELDNYERSFKRGRLQPRTLLLRVQTLISKGDATRARVLGANFWPSIRRAHFLRASAS